MTTTGVFVDVVGLGYKSDGATVRKTTSSFEYTYEPGQEVTFTIGNLELGSCVGKPITTVSDLISDNIHVFDAQLINRARLLFSLTPGQGFEQPVKIDDQVELVLNKYFSEIDLDSEELSDLDFPLGKICSELGLRPKSVPHTRNHLRREEAGFKVLRDFRIPSNDGGYVLADVYLPLEPHRKFPVLICCTIYGRRVPWGGPDIEDDEEILAFERAEDDWHSTPPGSELQMPELGPWSRYFTSQRGFENIATFNTFTYVPHGYAMVKIDPKGVSQTPGTRWVPGELTRDFFTAVEWCVDQAWSSGNIAVVGSSYGSNTQWGLAGLKPKGLKCFVPYATDIDSYRDAAYIGGVPSTKYLKNWFSRVRGVSPKWNDHIDVEKLMEANSSYNAFWEMLRSDPRTSVDIPCFMAASQIFMIHGRGAYEAWAVRQPHNSHLQLVDSDYYAWPSREAAAKIIQFLNHYLKTDECPPPERVGIQVRLGDQAWYWRKERNWPVPGTQYTKYHLDTEQGLSTCVPPAAAPEVRFSYTNCKPPEGQKSGVSFLSAPFTEDVDMAGHFKTVLTFSSSSPDADVVVMLFAIDKAGRVVAYGASSDKPEPLAMGFLRASHRKTDLEHSVDWRPWHTHRQDDVAPLQGPDDVVEIEVELMPAAARVRQGWRLRVDVSPSEDQPDIPDYESPSMRSWYGESAEGNGIDSIHVGGGRCNYVQCPIVPKGENYPNCMV